MEASQTEGLSELLLGLVGSELDSFKVTGRADGFVILGFHGVEMLKLASMEVLNPLTVRRNGRDYRRGDTGYFDALAFLIGGRVCEADYAPRLHIRIEFDSGNALSVSLAESDFQGPEAAVLNFERGKGSWGVWQVGD